MDWTESEVVERVAGRCSGQPTIRGTRISPDTVLQYFQRGASLEEILEDFPTLTGDLVRSLVVFADGERKQLAS